MLIWFQVTGGYNRQILKKSGSDITTCVDSHSKFYPNPFNRFRDEKIQMNIFPHWTSILFNSC